MRCPKCGNIKDKIKNNRHKDEDTIIKRRRECINCFHRWTTYELKAEDLRGIDDPLISRFLDDDN